MINTSCSISDCPNEATVYWPDLCDEHETELDTAELEWDAWKEEKENQAYTVNGQDPIMKLDLTKKEK